MSSKIVREVHKNEFIESYFDHACTIVTERDVLDTDIIGISWINTIKRKWYDLFLLSYMNSRARNYYHSTHGMRMDRFRHFQRHRGRIHPLSKFRVFWDIFMLNVFILYKLLLLVFTSVIFHALPIFAYYLALVLEFFMVFDIVINTRTGFIDITNRKVVLNKHLILRHYCATKLFFHTASAIPFVFIMFLRYGTNINCVLCKANKLNCVISFLTIINLFRVYELSSYWNIRCNRSRLNICLNFLRIGIIIILIVIQFLHYCDTMSLIHLINSKDFHDTIPHNKSFFNIIFKRMHVDEVHSSYVNAHFWRLILFLGMARFGKLVGQRYKVIYPHPLLRIFGYFLLTVCSCWLLVEVFCFLTSQRYFEEELRKHERYLLNLVKSRHLPDRFCSEIKQYFGFSAAKIKFIETEKGLYRSLPIALKNEISWHSYHRLIMRIPYFSDWPREVIEKLLNLLKDQIYLKNETIAEVGVPGEGLMIVHLGKLAVYTSECEEVGHLGDGDYFGELSLVTDNEVRATSVVAISNCKILLLDKIQFRRVMRGYPDLFHIFKEEIRKEYYN